MPAAPPRPNDAGLSPDPVDRPRNASVCFEVSGAAGICGIAGEGYGGHPGRVGKIVIGRPIVRDVGEVREARPSSGLPDPGGSPWGGRILWRAGGRGGFTGCTVAALAYSAATSFAIGTPARGVEGFRRSHLEALATQRMLVRLRSRQQIAFFDDVRMVALIAQNPDTAGEFIKSTLGDFESASSELQETVLTLINEQCNASRAAKRLHTHRNTLVRRLESAERLLPRPLDHSSVRVAVAREAPRWRGVDSSSALG
jgi:PucR C-terminal helix-turn-helix domain